MKRLLDARTTLGRACISFLAAVALISLWQFTVEALDVPSVVFPRPAGVALALWKGLFVSGVFWPHIYVTLLETLAGFAIGSVIGLILGVAIAESRVARAILNPYIVLFQNVPKVAIAPLFVIWFGFGMSSKIAIAAALGFFPVVINVATGMASVDAGRLELIYVFGGRRFWQFWLVKVPTAMPYFFAGLDIAAVLAIIGVIVAEYVGAKEGLGYLIIQYNFTLDMNGIFAALIILSLIGYAFHIIITAIGRRLVFWTKSNSSLAGGS